MGGISGEFLVIYESLMKQSPYRDRSSSGRELLFLEKKKWQYLGCEILSGMIERKSYVGYYLAKANYLFADFWKHESK